MSEVIYRNLTTGRLIERPASDPWLDESPGWEVVLDDETPATVGDEEDE